MMCLGTVQTLPKGLFNRAPSTADGSTTPMPVAFVSTQNIFFVKLNNLSYIRDEYRRLTLCLHLIQPHSVFLSITIIVFCNMGNLVSKDLKSNLQKPLYF